MLNVSVLGIEPIEPAVGGSRLRLMGLYRHLGEPFQVRYVGAFHSRGEHSRQLLHGERLQEITIPFSEEHFRALERYSSILGGTQVVDESFPRLGKLSSELQRYAQESTDSADIIVFSHPWVYSIVDQQLTGRTPLVIYDAHNFESGLRRQLLGDTPLERALKEEVDDLERRLCQRADLVACCSEEDRELFIEAYGLEPHRVHTVPNGVNCEAIRPAPSPGPEPIRPAGRDAGRAVALFIGGRYKPNQEAVEYTCTTLAGACPDVDFVILGNCGPAFEETSGNPALPANVHITGPVDDETKLRWLQSATIAINPMFSGSGTNVKMFDYLAAGLPIVTTPMGARGIAERRAMIVAETEQFPNGIMRLAADSDLRGQLVHSARATAEQSYDWPKISRTYGSLLEESFNNLRSGRPVARTRRRPLFSVTIPTLDRHEKLRRLLDLLTRQRQKDFEVIVVDQSDEPYDGPNPGLDLTVVYSSVKGSCRARNLAAEIATGRFLVLTDDDCEPGDNWLKEAGSVLQESECVGVEGRIISARMGDPEWRSVHNYGSESIGYLTCNLFVRAEAFERIGGFDERFDAYDFRYDTDFGWRLEALGDIPFSDRAFVYHPPWPRRIARESLEARNRMFAGDALLLKKHPQRYETLMLHENHWRHRAFWPHFLRGLEEQQIELPDYAQRLYEQMKTASPEVGERSE